MENENIAQEPEPMQAEPQPEPQQAQQDAPQQAQTGNPYQSIIDTQNEQIAALMAANKALTEQVTSFIQGGAQLGTQQTQQPQKPVDVVSLADDKSWSLEELASEIGKR